MTRDHHKQPGHHAHDVPAARCFILTVSDTRNEKTDEAGALVAERLEHAGHAIVGRQWVKDEVSLIRAEALRAVERRDVDVVILTGGTGIAPRDCTPEAVLPLFDKTLEGFGEAFRQLSFAEIGPRAILTRALAGVVQRTLVFVLPGSPRACRLAVEELLAPLLPHAVGLLHPAKEG